MGSSPGGSEEALNTSILGIPPANGVQEPHPSNAAWMANASELRSTVTPPMTWETTQGTL